MGRTLISCTAARTKQFKPVANQVIHSTPFTIFLFNTYNLQKKKQKRKKNQIKIISSITLQNN